jgi:hypothetical protein
VKNSKRGLLLGSLVAISPIALQVATSALSLFIVTLFRGKRLPKTYKIIALLLVFKIIWIASTYFLIKNGDFYPVFRIIVYDLIILLMLFFIFDKNVVKSMFIPVIFVFLIDFSFNFSMFFFNIDLLARYAPDYAFRGLVGVFNHPYVSIHISVVTFIIGVFFRSKVLMVAALAVLFATQSLRGPITGFLILSFMFFLRIRLSTGLIFFASLLFVTLVFIMTILHADAAATNSSYLREVKWSSALSYIVENPIFGANFLPENEHASVNGVYYSLKNAESIFLGRALDFGIITAVINPIIFYILMKINVKRFYRDGSNGSLSAALISIITFIDYFYGSFNGSILYLTIFSILSISHKGLRDVSSENGLHCCNTSK